MKFEFIIITPPKTVPNEFAWIDRLFAAGLQKLHIRKPSFSRSELRKYLSMISPRYHPRIVIHSHYSLAAEFFVGGIHLTEKSRKARFPSAFIPEKHSLSASFHSIEDVKRSRRKYDYIFLSPIFDSVSKKNYKSGLTKELLHQFLLEHKNIVALGGIDLKTVKLAKEMKFCGGATLGYIWKAKDPVNAFVKLRSKIK